VNFRELSQFMHKSAFLGVKKGLGLLTQASDWVSGNGEKASLAQAVMSWRRGRDLNPRHLSGEPDFESGAFSRARPPLRFITRPDKAKKVAKN
jgi:hypothetical protein